MAFPGDRHHGFTVAGDHDVPACESVLGETPRGLGVMRQRDGRLARHPKH